jgi:toxin YhaV
VICHGWQIFFHPLFAERFRSLRAEVAELKARLPDIEYRAHPRVRLLAAVVRLVRDTVPQNPNAPEFRLRDDLAKFRRVKGYGLPERYRLFWVFSSEAKTIVFLYLNDENTLRKEGSRTDPYNVFKALVQQEKIGEDFATNRLMIRESDPDQNTP